MAFERWGPSSSACHQLEQTNNRPQESAVPLGYAEVHHLEGWHFFYISAARSSATRSMKGLLAILLPKKNCSVGRACCIVLLMLNHQCWKSTFVRMNDWRSVMAGACPSASTGMQPLLFLKPANGFRNNDKSQLMLLSPTENQICNFCWQQSTAMCNCFGKNNVTYLTRPPGNPGYYEFITTVIGKFWCSTAVKRQKGQWSPSPVLKICIRRVWGCQRWDRRVKTVPEGTVLELELYTLSETWMAWTRTISLMARALQTGNGDDWPQALQAPHNQEEALGQGRWIANSAEHSLLYWKRVLEAECSISDRQENRTEITSSTLGRKRNKDRRGRSEDQKQWGDRKKFLVWSN